MSDAVIFSATEQDELDTEDPVQGLWRMQNEARARPNALDRADADCDA